MYSLSPPSQEVHRSVHSGTHALKWTAHSNRVLSIFPPLVRIQASLHPFPFRHFVLCPHYIFHLSSPPSSIVFPHYIFTPYPYLLIGLTFSIGLISCVCPEETAPSTRVLLCLSYLWILGEHCIIYMYNIGLNYIQMTKGDKNYTLYTKRSYTTRILQHNKLFQVLEKNNNNTRTEY